MQRNHSVEAVIDYWFATLKPRDWWRKSEQIDSHINRCFADCLTAARCGELAHWRDSAVGRLAEIIVLDQFPRHIHRDTPEAFASDTLALVLAQEAIRAGADQCIATYQRPFIYMPFMHSESALIQQQSVRLFNQAGMEDNLKFAQRHKDIIDRFGRYPHRNAILGRPSSAAEADFLEQPGSSF